jgi:membrane-associated phospholipid phosphatase
MSTNNAKNLMQSGFVVWLVSLAGVSAAVIVSVLWLDRPIALLAYGWFGLYRTVQHLGETTDFFGHLVVLGFAVLLARWMLARRFGMIDVVANLCIVTLAVAGPLRSWLKFIFGRTWPAYGQPSFIFEGVYGFHPFHGGPDFGSFPSGHAAAVCAVAVILWIYLPMLRALCALSVATISVALLAGDFHFLSDIIAGAFIGASLSALVVHLWEHRIRVGLLHTTLTGPRPLRWAASTEDLRPG